MVRYNRLKKKKSKKQPLSHLILKCVLEKLEQFSLMEWSEKDSFKSFDLLLAGSTVQWVFFSIA